MQGFDEEFADIEDYILRITDRIWKEKNFAAISRYYAADAVIHTLAGPVLGSEKVIAGTKSTLAAFPDRRLIAEEVIWGGDDRAGYYSSHRIISPDMTNLGTSDFGPPTGKRATVRTIADCAVRDNQVHEEWLMRDNLGLVLQLGLEPHAVAKQLARKNRANEAWRTWLGTEIERLRAAPMPAPPRRAPDPYQQRDEFARALIHALWRRPAPAVTESCYAPACRFHGPGGRERNGAEEMLRSIGEILAVLDERRAGIDHVCSRSRKAGELDIAARWTLTGVHKHDGLYGPATGKPLFILAASHWHIEGGKISGDWTVFDELAVLQQVYS